MSFNSHLPAPSNDHAPSFHISTRGKPLLSGYFGPTSFVSHLTDDVDLASEDQSPEEEAAQRVLEPYWVQKITEILLTLGDFTNFEELIREYYAISQSAVIPAPFVLNSLAPLKAMCQGINSKDLDDPTSTLTVRIIHNTAETFEIPPSIAGKDFHTLFTGSAIRLEAIGLACSLAGRASYFGLDHDKFGGQSSRSQFSRSMLALADTALYICKMLTPLNDLTIWLVRENLMLSDLVNGDSSKRHLILRMTTILKFK